MQTFYNMNTPAISIKNISKKYEISHQTGASYLALRDELTNLLLRPLRWFAGHRQKKEDFWALKDISFDVQKGEVLGIIGANGAGKSTLLKILSRITPPTSGEIKINGRVSSLLEVGTGFHAELSGRENIYLNGAILGMARAEIEKQFNNIVEFAGIEKFLDTPVKHYSSGMYVRLAFAVAAHLEPDILLVDEVLAVGDADFQKKSLGKMEEVTKKSGRTILFVSHNMTAMQTLCRRSLLLEKGRVKMIGPTEDVVRAHLRSPEKIEAIKRYASDPKKLEAQILKITVTDSEGRATTQIDMAKPFYIEIEYELKTAISAYAILKFFSTTVPNKYIVVSLSNDNNYKYPSGPGIYTAKLTVEPLFNDGTYSFLAAVSSENRGYLDSVVEYDTLRIANVQGLPFPTAQHGRADALVVLPMPWQVDKIK